ncbi:MAG: hypothetical protein JWP91_1866 [Fibrobacteres bacterium]|nr:hypothetical protein [Fibrobacterota bacterium]
MIEVRLEVGIRRSAEDVFSFLTELSNFKKWQEGIVSVEQIDPGPWRAGTRFKTIHSFLFWNNLIDLSEIVAVDANRRISNQGRVGKTSYREEFLLASEGEGMRLIYRADIEPGGVFSYMKTLSAWNFRSQMRRSFERLKVLMEYSPVSSPLVADAGAI